MMTDPTDLPQLLDNLADPAGERPTFADLASDPVAASEAAEPSLEAVNDVPVNVQAVLGRSRIPIGELLRMRAGMVLELDRRVGEPVDIFVNNRLIARGEVVMVDAALGVTLTEIVAAGA
jgi:flagellar motor switch protein FliN